MSYQKLDENNNSVQVSEAEHLKEFMGSIPNVKKYVDGKTPIDLVSLGGGTSFGMFNLVLEGKLLVPDTIRARVVAAMNYQLMRELEKVESNYEPKKRKYTVDVAVAPMTFNVKVDATSREEAEELVQQTIDSKVLDKDTVLGITRAVLTSVETLEAEEVRDGTED